MRDKMTKKRIPKEFFIVFAILFVIGVVVPYYLNAFLIVDSKYEIKRIQEELVSKTWIVENGHSTLSFTSDGRVFYQGSRYYFHVERNIGDSTYFELVKRIRDGDSDFIAEGRYTLGYCYGDDPVVYLGGDSPSVIVKWNKVEELSEPSKPFFTPSELKSVVSFIFYYPRKPFSIWKARMSWGEHYIFEKSADASESL